ncbi:MAG TPA: hypothetical protein VF676_06975 [Flavobacterium sp.]|jgi:hypothetical protein
MNRSLLTILIFSFSNFYSQTIDIAETTLKVSAFGEEALFYGFAEGDQLIFNFEELNGKELKELEISELGSSSMFMDYKSKKVENKIVNINRTGIYKFRLYNSSLGGRICKVKIQRLPATESTRKFNSAVYWKTINDTIYRTEQENYLIGRDTVVNNLTDIVAKVHSVTNANGNKTICGFSLPPNTVAWSYYLGVGQEGQKAYEEASKELASKFGPKIAKIPSYGPVAALALGGVSYLATLQSGEDIDYYITDTDNMYLFMAAQPFRCLKQSKVINAFSQMKAPLLGNFYVCLSNDNAVMGVAVTVKVTAITVTEQWGTRPVQRYTVTSHQEPYLKI